MVGDSNMARTVTLYGYAASTVCLPDLGPATELGCLMSKSCSATRTVYDIRSIRFSPAVIDTSDIIYMTRGQRERFYGHNGI